MFLLLLPPPLPLPLLPLPLRRLRLLRLLFPNSSSMSSSSSGGGGGGGAPPPPNLGPPPPPAPSSPSSSSPAAVARRRSRSRRILALSPIRVRPKSSLSCASVSSSNVSPSISCCTNAAAQPPQSIVASHAITSSTVASSGLRRSLRTALAFCLARRFSALGLSGSPAPVGCSAKESCFLVSSSSFLRSLSRRRCSSSKWLSSSAR